MLFRSGVIVTDDTHQNPGNGWNGDSIQMVFANAAQDTVTHLYNYGLSDAGDVVIHNEKGPGGTEVSITRDDDTTTTLYEFAFPAASLGLDAYESGMSIGVGVCVNDGDTQDGQSGQKGWSGWGPYAAVYGKTASATGLVSLVGEAPGPILPPELPWSVGMDDNGWPAGDGGGANTSFMQEAGVNDLPGNPASPEVAQQADDDYYWAGVYSTVIAGNGDYTPVGLVEVNEEAAERAFAGIDNDLRYHFNLPERSEERRVGEECRSRWSPYQ